jgi:FMN-dependent NADH-azoreductase
MTKILYLTSSPSGSHSYSNRVAERLLSELRQGDPNSQVTHRDLARNPLPHIDEDFVYATRAPGGPVTQRQRDLLALSNTLVDELLTADFVVLATAMINFSIPSTLKAWIDQVARAGRTFRYGEHGAQGLVTGKRVALIVAKGGVYSGDLAPMDFQTPYLQRVLGFLGMTNVQVFEVEGTAYGAEAAEQAVEAAFGKISQRCAEAHAA